MKNFIVEEAQSGLKLLKFLKLKFDAISLKKLKMLLEQNLCKINGTVERFATAIVYKGDKISFQLEENFLEKPKTQILLKQRILYEDENLLIYDKEAGVTSDSFKTAYFLIHRLDKGTSGILMFAKNETMLKAMIELFREREVDKTYFALVEGAPKSKKGRIENYLVKKHVVGEQAIWGSCKKGNGLEAVTDWEIERKFLKGPLNGCCLMRCKPKTGRTHQLRVHLKEMGCPILGDYHYFRDFKWNFKPKRTLLHASNIAFIDPLKNTKVEVESKLPEDFKEWMRGSS